MNKFEKIFKTIREWEKENEVSFIGSFISFDDKGEVNDNKIIAYGDRDCAKIALKGLTGELEKDESEFINW